MKTATGVTVIANGRLIDGTGAPPVPDAAVVLRDGRIAYAGPVAGRRRPRRTRGGSTPSAARSCRGWSRRNYHPTYFDVAALEDLDVKYPVEYVTLLASVNARLALECGYTAARSGGSLFNIDFWLKKAIENDLILGPRLAASGREICGVGGLMDWNPDFRKIGMEGLVLWSTAPPSAGGRAQAGQGRRRVGQDLPHRRCRLPDTNDHHTLSMTFEENARLRRGGPQPPPQGDRPLPGDARHQERPPGRLRRGGARHVHRRRGLGFAVGARRAGGAGVAVRVRQHRARRAIRHVAAVIDGHKETLEAGRRAPAASSRRAADSAWAATTASPGTRTGPTPRADFLCPLCRFSPLDVIRCATQRGAEILGRADEIGTLEAASWPTCWWWTATCRRTLAF